jgi:hypothetical protein
MAKDKMKTEEEDDTQKPTKKGAIWGGVLSMLPTIAGTIPSLMKSKQTGALKAMQRGQGAGAMAARQAGSEAARRVAGNVQGANLREGLRTADRLTQRGATAAGNIGAREGALATSQLLAEEQRRRGIGLQLGAGLGGAGATMIATLLAAKDQGPDLNAQKTGLARDPMGLREAGDLGAQQGPTWAAGTPTDQPFLQTGARGTRENFQPLQPPGVLGQQGQIGGQPFGVQAPIPQTQLQGQGMQPTGAAQTGQQAPSALSSMVTKATPEQKMEQGKKAYVQSVTKPSEVPFTGASKGGSDQQYISQATTQILEETLAKEVDKFERTGGAFGMSPVQAEQLLNWYKTTGQMSDEVKRMLPDGGNSGQR